MIWGLAIVSLLAFALAFTSHSAGWMGLCIAVGLVCGIAAAVLFIDRHLRASSRPEHMTEREIEALRNTLRKPGEPRPKRPPGPRD
jgi:hypothetical protein